MDFAFATIDTIRREEPDLFDADLERRIEATVVDASTRRWSSWAACSSRASPACRVMMCAATSSTAATTVSSPRPPPAASATNPFGFMDLQDVQEHANFFERTVSAYEIGVNRTVTFDEDL